MSKCEHGQKITTFCASECCVWKEAGGCATCIKKYHNHMGPTIFITEQQCQQIIKKFNVDPATKPKCRTLQQVIFNYFNIIKTEFTTFIDNACMDIINQIGHPYLTHHGLLSTYKRIKKKDYKKIQQKEFKQFYETSQKVSENQLVQNEKRIYLEKVKKKSDFINALEKTIKNIQRLNAQFEVNYLTVHDGSLNVKINEIVKNITKSKPDNIFGSGSLGGSLNQSDKMQNMYQKNSELVKNQKSDKLDAYALADSQQFIPNSFKTTESSNRVDTSGKQIKDRLQKDLERQKKLQREKQKQKQRIKQIEKEIQMDKQKFKQKEREREKQRQKERQKQREREKQKIKQKQQQRKKLRLNSLDKHFTKTNNLQKKRETEKQKMEASIQQKVNENIPQNNKQRQKLKQLEKRPKQGQKQQISPKRRAFQCKQLEINQKKQKLIDMMKQRQDNGLTKMTKIPLLDTPHSAKSHKGSENKISENQSGSSLENKQDKLHLFAHTALPRTESRKKLFEEAEQVAQKTIIVPVQEKLQGNKIQECVSPLLKYKFKSKEYDNRPQPRTARSKEAKQPFNISPTKVQNSKQDLMELTDPQSKSLALLIKSLSVKAEQAVTYLQSALQYADDNLSAAQYLSYLYLQLDRPKQCLIICNKMLQKLVHSNTANQLSWHLKLNKCAALNKLGRYSQSIVILEQCLKSKQHAKLYKNLGDAYFSIGIYEKSNYYYEKAVGLEDNFDEAHYNLAVCLFMQQNFYNARFSIIKALHYSPKNQTYLQLQKEINLRIKDF